MRDYTYVEDFKKLGFGMFVHFGLYSVWGCGEWGKLLKHMSYEEYDKALDKFVPVKSWAKELVKAAKQAGMRYIVLTTRHHDGFSLYDTKGLSDYDVVHAKCGRDLVREFVDACNEGGVVPFFYHTLLDWRHPDFTEKNETAEDRASFARYIDYLVKSVEVLCTNYGKIGGLWFDGMWSNWEGDWQEDRLYGTIRKHQPTAMIINNTGLSFRGKQGHPELDSVTFERGDAAAVAASDRPRAGEVCDALNFHWGYAENDVNYKPITAVLKRMIGCRETECNMLLNVGPMGNGRLRTIDLGYLESIGQWIKATKNVFYSLKPCSVTCDGATVLTDGRYCYAVYDCSIVVGTNDVVEGTEDKTLSFSEKISSARYLESGKPAKIKGNTIICEGYDYSYNLGLRVIRFTVKK